MELYLSSLSILWLCFFTIFPAMDLSMPAKAGRPQKILGSLLCNVRSLQKNHLALHAAGTMAGTSPFFQRKK